MASSEAHIRAVAKYYKSNIKTFLLQLNINTDADIILWMEKCENKNGYMKKLIREDMIKCMKK